MPASDCEVAQCCPASILDSMLIVVKIGIPFDLGNLCFLAWAIASSNAVLHHQLCLKVPHVENCDDDDKGRCHPNLFAFLMLSCIAEMAACHAQLAIEVHLMVLCQTDNTPCHPFPPPRPLLVFYSRLTLCPAQPVLSVSRQ